jgi:hypothetical protein
VSDQDNPLSALIAKNSGGNGNGDAGGGGDNDDQTGGGDSSSPDKVIWEPATAAEDYDVRLADGSIRPQSESSLRSMVLELKKAGMIDVRHALMMLDIVDADDIADAVEQEMKLAALAKVQRK